MNVLTIWIMLNIPQIIIWQRDNEMQNSFDTQLFFSEGIKATLICRSIPKNLPGNESNDIEIWKIVETHQLSLTKLHLKWSPYAQGKMS